MTRRWSRGAWARASAVGPPMSMRTTARANGTAVLEVLEVWLTGLPGPGDRRGHAVRHDPCGDVVEHERAGADHRVGTDGDAVDDVRTQADGTVVPDPHRAAGGRPRPEARVILDVPVVVDRRVRAEEHAAPELAPVAHDRAREQDATGTEGRVVGDDRRRMHDRYRSDLRARGALAFEDPSAGRVVADGYDEVVGVHLGRAHPQLVVGAEDGDARDLVAARECTVEHTDDGVETPRHDGVDHLASLVGAADHDDPAHDDL